jgi:hypothetical protein
MSASGNGAGCPRRWRSGGIGQNPSENRSNSRGWMSIAARSPGSFHCSLEKTRTYSHDGTTWGFEGLRQLPQAVRRPIVCLYQMISVRMMKPNARRSVERSWWIGRKFLIDVGATFSTNRPPGTRTRWRADQTPSSQAR